MKTNNRGSNWHIGFRLTIFILFLTAFSSHAFSKTKDNQPYQAPKESKGFLSRYMHEKDFQIFPIPVYDRRPDRGNTYGVMPVLVVSDKGKNEINSIFALIGKYNSITKWAGAALAYFYPKPDMEIKVYAEFAQKYARELELRYFDPHLQEHIYFDSRFYFVKSPFGRFFGIGPARVENDQSTFTSRQLSMDLTLGYYFTDDFRANWHGRFNTVDILTRANKDIPDTQRTYGFLPNVVDSTNLINEFSLTYDTRKQERYSERGHKIQAAYFFSAKGLGSDKTFHGFDLEYVNLFPIIKDRLTQAFRFEMKRIFGNNIPFYELASLGGESEFRAFTPLRFVDQGKMVFQLEERIKIFTMTLFDKTFSGSVDPFIEIGRVFDKFADLGLNRWQPVGGIGLRLVVPPNIVGRLDIAMGSDGVEIYTELGYPF